MKNAAIIRRAARECLSHAKSLEMHKILKNDYGDLLQKLIYDEFRPLFAQWVASFDNWDYIINRWELFNPPGIYWEDKDPDDDIPFKNPLADDD